jgi:ferredoxin
MSRGAGDRASDRAGDRAGVRLRVDPVACDGIGMCAHLADRLVRLDSWGYPIVPERGLGEGELRAAEKAVAGCPRRALTLHLAVPAPPPPPPPAARLTT